MSFNLENGKAALTNQGALSPPLRHLPFVR